MRKLVIDTSIVWKWFDQSESSVDKALELYKLMGKGEVEIYAPSLLLIELANLMFWKKKFSKAEIAETNKRIIESGIKFINIESKDMNEIINMMHEHNLTAYDSIYLWMAKNFKCKLVSSDKELLKAKEDVVSL